MEFVVVQLKTLHARISNTSPFHWRKAHHSLSHDTTSDYEFFWGL